MTKPTIAAIVVTFNRKKLLKDCLDALLAQTTPLDAIYIIDNASTDGTRELLLAEGFLQDQKYTPIHYTLLDANQGGAGGFHEGVKQGAEADFDWLWLMDDDAKPQPAALENLFNSAVASEEDTVVLACKKVDQNGQIQPHHCGLFDPKQGHIRFTEEDYREGIVSVNYASFVGFAVKTAAVKKVGFPRKDFFITHDDLEYSLRLGKMGQLYLITDSIIVHQDVFVRKETSYHWKRIPVEEISLYWRYLCDFRNRLYVKRQYGNVGLIGWYTILFRRLTRIVFFDRDHKWLRFKWTILFFSDLFRRQFRVVTPAQWSELVTKK